MGWIKKVVGWVTVGYLVLVLCPCMAWNMRVYWHERGGPVVSQRFYMLVMILNTALIGYVGLSRATSILNVCALYGDHGQNSILENATRVFTDLSITLAFFAGILRMYVQYSTVQYSAVQCNVVCVHTKYLTGGNFHTTSTTL